MRQPVNAIDQPFKLVGSSIFGRYDKISVEKTYNMFISDEWLVNFAAYERVLELLATGEGRGAFVSSRGNFAVVVVNANVYRISPSLGKVFIGSLDTSSGEVFIDENLSNQICLVDGVNAYIYHWPDPPNLTKQTGGEFGTNLIPNYVTYHNTFFLFGNALKNSNGSAWFVYKENAGDLTQITLFATQALQTKADFALAVKRIPSQSSNVMVFGAGVCEIHSNVSSAPTTTGVLPYRRNSSVSIDYGCLSVNTIASNEDKIAWLGVNASSAPVIMVYAGQKEMRISTDGIDALLSRIHHPEKSTALFYRQDGHLFYQLTFYHIDLNVPDLSDNLTLVYDFNTESFFHLSDQNLNYHPARQVIYFNQQTYFVSLNNGSMYRWSTDLTQINEDLPGDVEPDPRLVFDMQRIRVCDTIRHPKTAPFSAKTAIITIDQGNDTTPGIQECLVYMIGENGVRMFDENLVQLVPEHHGNDNCFETPYRGRVDLSISKDGGVTFSNTVSRYTNPLGVRMNIMKWENLGWCNELTPKFRFWLGGHSVVQNGILEIIQDKGGA
jgi:hypothetical protein